MDIHTHGVQAVVDTRFFPPAGKPFHYISSPSQPLVPTFTGRIIQLAEIGVGSRALVAKQTSGANVLGKPELSNHNKDD
jgi:hypothetical protein